MAIIGTPDGRLMIDRLLTSVTGGRPHGAQTLIYVNSSASYLLPFECVKSTAKLIRLAVPNGNYRNHIRHDGDLRSWRLQFLLRTHPQYLPL